MDGIIVFRPIVLRMLSSTPPRKPAKRLSAKPQYRKAKKDAAPVRKAA